MAGSFEFMSGAEPFISTRIKMAETSNLRIVAQADGKFFMATREIKVTIGGCGDA
jgi:sulfur-oxidizing protein SoxY